MNFNNGLQLNQTQKLTMNMQLKQSLNILNMTRQEVEEEIKRESEENPLLEAEKSTEIDWESYIKDIENNSYKIDRNEVSFNPDNEIDLENLVKYSANIYDHLIFQVSTYKLDNKVRKTCEYIIECLDEDGYLRVEDDAIIKELNISKEVFEDSLDTIWQLEPSGIGARSLSECLIIQLKNLGVKNQILENIIKEDLDLVAQNKYKEISKKYKLVLQNCINLVGIIRTLDPRPGRVYSVERSVYIQPDVIVEKIDNEFVVYLSEKDGYKLKINNYYKEILKNSLEDKSAKDFIKEKLNSATGLMRNIESRKSTILKIAQEIFNSQTKFFEKGPKYLKPLRMKDIAECLEFHESTISRGVNGKYMLTPFGVFEFKYFFSSALETEENGLASSTSIKNTIKDIIKSEDKKKPFSDEYISKKLKESGVNIARRTVAKYREDLGILSSSRRKQI